MTCDICGSEGKMYKARIEGAELKVCIECSSFGKVIGIVASQKDEAESNKFRKFGGFEGLKPEKIDKLVDDYTEKIRKGRESLGLNQKDFAKKINEKESLIQNIESGHYEPTIGTAKKIARFLKIKLVEEYEESYEKTKQQKSDTFTIGDFIKLK